MLGESPEECVKSRIICRTSLQDLRKQSADSKHDMDGVSEAAWAQKGTWPVHPDVCVQLNMEKPTIEAQRIFLAQLEAESLRAAWSLCAQVGADAAGLTGNPECMSSMHDTMPPCLPTQSTPICGMLEHRCSTFSSQFTAFLGCNV